MSATIKPHQIFPPLVSLVVLTFTWELLVRGEWVSPLLLPAPSQVGATLWAELPMFQTAFSETATSVGAGFVLSVCLGFFVAVLFSLNSFLKHSLLPFAVFFQTVPIIAIAPLLVIYLGFGPPTVISSTLIVSIFPMIASSLAGLDSVDKNSVDLFRLYHASAWQTLWKLRVPKALASIFAGLKITAGLAVIGAVAGEFVAGGGLGALIDSARTQQRLDIVFAAIFLLSFLGLLLIFLIDFLQWVLFRWRPFHR